MIRLLLAIQMVVGGLLLLAGSVFPYRPAFLLDVVLTPDELQNSRLRETASLVLKRSHALNHSGWQLMACGVVIVASSIGLAMSLRQPGDVAEDES